MDKNDTIYDDIIADLTPDADDDEDEEYDDLFDSDEADEKMAQIIGFLKAAIKKDVKDELEQLRAENAELRKIADEYARKKFDLMTAERDLERNFKKMKIRELFGEYIVKAWVVNEESTPRPKCNKCNSLRKIVFYSPQGRAYSEDCECGKKIVTYKPFPTELIRIIKEIDSKPRGVYLQAGYYTNKNDELWCRTDSVYKGEKFEDIPGFSITRIVFLDKEKCEEFCEYLNNKEKGKE